MNSAQLSQDRILSKFMARTPQVTATIHDFQRINKSLYRVIATLSTSDLTEDQLRVAIAGAVGNNFGIVESSFRPVVGAKIPAVVGFVAANRTSMDYETASTKGFREVAKNIFMSPEDESLWSLNIVGATKTLVRNLPDDLDQVMASARLRAYNVPKLAQLEIASLAPSMEYAAFVDGNTQKVRYGFVLAVADEVNPNGDESFNVEGDDEEEGQDPDEMVAVQCAAGDIARISIRQIVESAYVGKEFAEIAKEEGWDLPSNVSQTEYYRKLYSYAPDYTKMIQEQIEGHAVV